MKKYIITAALGLALAAAITGDAMSEEKAVATFAGGCFWCMEPPFDKVDGVLSTTSGYTGGKVDNPTYKQVCDGTTGHAEALRVEYDPTRVSYRDLLEVYWRNIDPTTPNRQFCDYGDQYRPEIFYHDEEQKRLAEASKERVEASGLFDKVAVRISEAGPWYDAEDYHQDFYKKDPDRYYSYRKGCGRDARLSDLWDRWEGPILPDDMEKAETAGGGS
jgi:peptide-methionine (S)-S-oxide reductase